MKIKMLHFNKLYQSLKKVNGEWHAGHVEWYFTWHYLKFFEEGVVIQASFAGENPALINKFFTKENTHFNHGAFWMENKIITLNFNQIQVKGFMNNDFSIIFDGARHWEIYYAIF